jgi:hypothetical protein
MHLTLLLTEHLIIFFMSNNGIYFADSGNFHFSPAVSAGLAPAGPIYKAVSVKLSKDAVNKETSTWLTCRKEGVLAELDGQSVLDDLDNEVCECTISFCHLLLNSLKNHVIHYYLHSDPSKEVKMSIRRTDNGNKHKQ